MSSLYDSRLVQVSEALKHVDNSGDCFTCGSLSQFPLPGLVIDGLGEVLLPLSEYDAKRLITKCRLLNEPNDNEQTTVKSEPIVKTEQPNVNSWELDATQLQLVNPKWPTLINSIVKSIIAPLGINEVEESGIQAQLHKLLLFEEGGKCDLQQDSENDNVFGKFGTLVVMLPCRFEGGELHVHHPSRADDGPYVWSPGSMNSYDVKYAAYYGDCSYEMKPVTAGYRLCLTYKLVTSATSRVPRFVGNQESYERIKTAVDNFFTLQQGDRDIEQDYTYQYKQARLSDQNHIQNMRDAPQVGQRDARLVYILQNKHISQGLSFAYLKDKDRLVAQCFAKYCKEKLGAFSLYLCKIYCTYECDPDKDDDDSRFKHLELKSPWIKYGETTTHQSHTDAKVKEEVVPTGFFEEVPFDGYIPPRNSESKDKHKKLWNFDNKGKRQRLWAFENNDNSQKLSYWSAALVVQPTIRELNRDACAGMHLAVTKWIEFVENGSPHVNKFASAIFARKRDWTTNEMCFIDCMRAVCQMGSVDIFYLALCSLSKIYFQPALASTVQKLGWNRCLGSVVQVAATLNYPSRLNLVCSVLHEVTDVSTITLLLDRVDLDPQQLSFSEGGSVSADGYYYKEPTQQVVSGAEYSRLLKIALLVSPDKFRPLGAPKLLATPLINTVAPGVVVLVNSFRSPSEVPSCVVDVAQKLHELLKFGTPQWANWLLQGLQDKTYCCVHCSRINEFLTSSSQEATRMTIRKADRHHIHEVLVRYNRVNDNALSYHTEQPNTLVITKYSSEIDLQESAREAIDQLRSFLEQRSIKVET